MKTREEMRAYWRARRDTQDPDPSMAKRDRIDLGLAVLSAIRKPGASFSHFDLALWCGCTDSMIYLIEKRALRKVGNALRFGCGRGVGAELLGGSTERQERMSAEDTRAAVACEERMSAEATRAAAARAYPQHAHGSGPVPDYVVNAMAADYARLGSLRQVAALYGGRDMTTIRHIFKARGIPLKGRGGPNHTKKEAA